MRYLRGILACLLLLGGCLTESQQRSSVKLVEAEIQAQRGSTTSIRRVLFQYDGTSGKLREVAFFVNGEPAGRMDVTYEDDSLAAFDIIDPVGHRGEMRYGYDSQGRVRSTLFTAPEVSSTMDTYDYRDGMLREVHHQYMPAGGDTLSSYTRFEYDESLRLDKITEILGDASFVEEIRYDEEDRVDRITTFGGEGQADVSSFAYNSAGRLDNVVLLSNERWDLTYRSDGRIQDIRRLSPNTGETVTVSYTYGEGDVKGFGFVPDLPAGMLFDLEGDAFTSISLPRLHPAGLGASVPAPPSSNGSGGSNGGSNGDGACHVDPWSTPCDLCRKTSCCDEWLACSSSQVCADAVQCVESCPSDAWICYDECAPAESSPARPPFDDLFWCTWDNCWSACLD